MEGKIYKGREYVDVTMHPYKLVGEFSQIFKRPMSEVAKFPSVKERKLRKALLKEEFKEYLKAEKEDDLVEVADALADLIYIICGTAHSYGIPLDEIFAEVHRSNMTKLDEYGQPILRKDGKVMKGPNFELPRIKEILDQHNQNWIKRMEVLANKVSASKTPKKGWEDKEI